MSATAEDMRGVRKVYRDHNPYVHFGVTLMATAAATLGLTGAYLAAAALAASASALVLTLVR